MRSVARAAPETVEPLSPPRPAFSRQDWLKSMMNKFNPLKRRPGNPTILDFERPLFKVVEEIEELKRISETHPNSEIVAAIASLESDLESLQKETFASLTPVQRLQLARHPNRPTFLDIVYRITDGFMQLHGDRAGYDDPAIVCGVARIGGRSVMLVGQQKGRNTRENIARNFGMPQPYGYRKALRFMRLADKQGLPIVTFVDTPGAFAGLQAEELGQGEAIAVNLREMFGFSVPIISVVIGEGGSGGALAIGCANRNLILENSVYYVASPEACAAILWKSRSETATATTALRILPEHLLEAGVMDEIVAEAPGGNHFNPRGGLPIIREAVLRNLALYDELSASEIRADRYAKFRKIGAFTDHVTTGGDWEAALEAIRAAPGAHTAAGTWTPTQADAEYVEHMADLHERWEQTLREKREFLNPPRTPLGRGTVVPGLAQLVARASALREAQGLGPPSSALPNMPGGRVLRTRDEGVTLVGTGEEAGDGWADAMDASSSSAPHRQSIFAKLEARALEQLCQDMGVSLESDALLLLRKDGEDGGGQPGDVDAGSSEVVDSEDESPSLVLNETTPGMAHAAAMAAARALAYRLQHMQEAADDEDLATRDERHDGGQGTTSGAASSSVLSPALGTAQSSADFFALSPLERAIVQSWHDEGATRRTSTEDSGDSDASSQSVFGPSDDADASGLGVTVVSALALAERLWQHRGELEMTEFLAAASKNVPSDRRDAFISHARSDPALLFRVALSLESQRAGEELRTAQRRMEAQEARQRARDRREREALVATAPLAVRSAPSAFFSESSGDEEDIWGAEGERREEGVMRGGRVQKGAGGKAARRALEEGDGEGAVLESLEV
ncbi:acetyl co-enzyme A carboxylase carboxyltransferase (alpha subunit) [Helicosporidium sp. ATCC 50920]|nr:acetyl co-enzyme A carboxylase carboxyltransferase (alpha subunit) [Helicosporidium sp. ATCC 50920]|eukprot:KDD76578.1 acetyl co-enzyme A carboxylase carboxyltransferase (alpha subunit) [Helicosporidium sp. ATCC 50920]